MNRTNFPGRKNRRRMDALQKLEAVAHPTVDQKRIMATLRERIVPPAQALNTFSKKWRGSGEPPTGSRATK